MTRKFSSACLLVVMMIMVLHNAVPHHHHEDVFTHRHEVHYDLTNPHACHDSHPVSCLIQSLNFSLPRSLTLVNNDVPATIAFAAGTEVYSILLSDAGITAQRLPIPPGDPLNDAFLEELPPRAPPC